MLVRQGATCSLSINPHAIDLLTVQLWGRAVSGACVYHAPVPVVCAKIPAYFQDGYTSSSFEFSNTGKHLDLATACLRFVGEAIESDLQGSGNGVATQCWGKEGRLCWHIQQSTKVLRPPVEIPDGY
jgi:hypothetical protein